MCSENSWAKWSVSISRKYEGGKYNTSTLDMIIYIAGIDIGQGPALG